jgi:hypothetical protein
VLLVDIYRRAKSGNQQTEEDVWKKSRDFIGRWVDFVPERSHQDTPVSTVTARSSKRKWAVTSGKIVDRSASIPSNIDGLKQAPVRGWKEAQTMFRALGRLSFSDGKAIGSRLRGSKTARLRLTEIINLSHLCSSCQWRDYLMYLCVRADLAVVEFTPGR